MHDEAVAASSQPPDTFGRYLLYEWADSYGSIEVTKRYRNLDTAVFKIVCDLFTHRYGGASLGDREMY